MNADPRLVGAILRSDFYSFIRAIFPIVSSNDAFASNWHIEAIAYQLPVGILLKIQVHLIFEFCRAVRIVECLIFRICRLGHEIRTI